MTRCRNFRALRIFAARLSTASQDGLGCADRRRALAGFVLLLGLLDIRVADAAISVDNVTTAVSPGQVTGLTWSHTVNSASNGILIVGISFRDGNTSASSVTFGAAALTRIGFQNSGGNQNRTELWYLKAPAVGPGTISVSMSSSKAIAAASISFTGVDQTSPLGTFASAAGDSQTPSVDVASAACEVVIDTMTANGDANSLAVSGGQTQQWNIFTGSGDAGNARGGGSTRPGATSTTMSWNLGVSKPWSIGAVPLRPSSSGPSLTVVKSSVAQSDPFNNTTNPKRIPGGFVTYSILVTNSGCATADNNSTVVLDTIPANTELFVGDVGGAGSGPVMFAQGSPSSGLTYTYTSLASTTDDLSFSNNNGVAFTYTPIANANGVDPAVTTLRVNPKGVLAAAGAGNPSFTVNFRVRIK
jgi:uncharacterized repeat protein (TIGR01451 family)